MNMTNMSYCRFQNTAADLRDCSDAMDEQPSSYEERLSRWRLIRLCVRIAEDYGDEGSNAARPRRETAA
jgi:hypothetical protein